MIKKKQFKLILAFLFALTLVSAVSVCEDTCYAGESYIINETKSYDFWSFVGNENNITEEDLTVFQNEDYTINVTLDKYMKSDSFELIFFNKVTVGGGSSSSGGGGGSSIKYIDRNFTEYLDRDVIKEIAGPKVEVETVTNKIPTWGWLLIGALLVAVIYLLYLAFRDDDSFVSGIDVDENKTPPEEPKKEEVPIENENPYRKEIPFVNLDRSERRYENNE